LYASAAELDEAESKLDVPALVTQGLRGTTLEQFHCKGADIKSEVSPALQYRASRSTATA